MSIEVKLYEYSASTDTFTESASSPITSEIAYGISWQLTRMGGCGVCNFELWRNFEETTDIDHGYGIEILENGNIRYFGIIQDLEKTITKWRETIPVTCVGLSSRLDEVIVSGFKAQKQRVDACIKALLTIFPPRSITWTAADIADMPYEVQDVEFQDVPLSQAITELCNLQIDSENRNYNWWVGPDRVFRTGAPLVSANKTYDLKNPDPNNVVIHHFDVRESTQGILNRVLVRGGETPDGTQIRCIAEHLDSQLVYGIKEGFLSNPHIKNQADLEEWAKAQLEKLRQPIPCGTMVLHLADFTLKAQDYIRVTGFTDVPRDYYPVSVIFKSPNFEDFWTEINVGNYKGNIMEMYDSLIHQSTNISQLDYEAQQLFIAQQDNFVIEGLVGVDRGGLNFATTLGKAKIAGVIYEYDETLHTLVDNKTNFIYCTDDPANPFHVDQDRTPPEGVNSLEIAFVTCFAGDITGIVDLRKTFAVTSPNVGSFAITEENIDIQTLTSEKIKTWGIDSIIQGINAYNILNVTGTPIGAVRFREGRFTNEGRVILDEQWKNDADGWYVPPGYGEYWYIKVIEDEKWLYPYYLHYDLVQAGFLEYSFKWRFESIETSPGEFFSLNFLASGRWDEEPNSYRVLHWWDGTVSKFGLARMVKGSGPVVVSETWNPNVNQTYLIKIRISCTTGDIWLWRDGELLDPDNDGYTYRDSAPFPYGSKIYLAQMGLTGFCGPMKITSFSSAFLEEETTNLCSYGCFELDTNADGRADGWQIAYTNISYALSMDSVNTRSGFYCQKVELSSPTASWSFYLYNDPFINVSGGIVYSVSSHVKMASITGTVRIELFLEWYDSSYAFISKAATPSYSNITEWTRLKIENVTSPANAVFARISHYIYGTASDYCTIFFDDTQLEEKEIVTSFCPELEGQALLDGYSWAGTPFASQCSRTAARIMYPCPANFNREAYSILMCIRPQFPADTPKTAAPFFFYMYFDVDNILEISYDPASDAFRFLLKVAGTHYAADSPAQTFSTDDNIQLAVTFSTADMMRLYLNGALVATNPNNTMIELPAEMAVGGWISAPSANAFIDELEIRNYKMSATEIDRYYRKTLPALPTSRTSLKAFFDGLVSGCNTAFSFENYFETRTVNFSKAEKRIIMFTNWKEVLDSTPGDTAWRELDLTNSTSAWADGVFVILQVLDGTEGNRAHIRKKGSEDAYHVVARVPYTNAWGFQNGYCAMDGNQTVEYSVTSSTARIVIRLLGYTEPMNP